MIETYGLTHLALAVKNAKRSFEFYREIFGVEKVYDQGSFIQAQTPGARDVLVFDEKAKRKGERGSIDTGTAKIGKKKVTFTVTAVDNGNPGTLDTFNIQVSNGYSAGGNLISGNISIH